MRANRRKNTRPEKALRSALYGRGLRYRVDYPIQMPTGRPVRPDVVFPARRVAVYLDGCFWHGCPHHGTTPNTNVEYWTQKIADNQTRDVRHTQALAEAGWHVIRVWEHELPGDAAARIAAAISARGSRTRATPLRDDRR